MKHIRPRKLWGSDRLTRGERIAASPTKHAPAKAQYNDAVETSIARITSSSNRIQKYIIQPSQSVCWTISMTRNFVDRLSLAKLICAAAINTNITACDMQKVMIVAIASQNSGSSKPVI